MKDRVSNDIGTKEPLQDWSTIDWKTIKKRVRNLRKRIYRATQAHQWNRVRSLMKLMLRSYSNLLLSVGRVTSENRGRKTAGVDNQTVLNPQDRVRLVRDMKTDQFWQAKPTKRIYIPKSNGKRRPLGIPKPERRILMDTVKRGKSQSIQPWKKGSKLTNYRQANCCFPAIAAVAKTIMFRSKQQTPFCGQLWRKSATSLKASALIQPDAA
ncbi:reverse transcriptase N-terminal domain-containing protein [Microseira sp. BLCC-F43]|uniref:reverse transcriptase N-terminal domain-containing protein n=1 Tax=Microseira sp. BLCC-F43 TaxID=3153602 RepID=UPI0035BA0167